MIINTQPQKGILPNFIEILESIELESTDLTDLVDDTTIEIVSSLLQVKDGSITNAKLANDIILYVSTTETSQYNSNAEHTLWSFTLPANSLSTGNMVEMNGFFQIDNQSGSNQTLTIQLYYDDTLIDTLTTGNLSNSSNLSLAKVSAVLKGDGTTSSQEGHLHIDIGGRSLSYDLSGTAAEDSTSAKDIAIKITLGAAHANYGFLTESFNARLLKV